MSRQNALGPGGKAGLVKCDPGKDAPATRSGVVTGPSDAPLTVAVSDSPEVEPVEAVVEVLPPVSDTDAMLVAVLDRAWAIPPEEQIPGQREILESALDRLDRIGCIGIYAGLKPPRNAVAMANAIKLRLLLTFGQQVRRSQQAVVQETHKEIRVTYVQAPTVKPN